MSTQQYTNASSFYRSSVPLFIAARIAAEQKRTVAETALIEAREKIDESIQKAEEAEPILKEER
ncbi:hypothetical protein PilKf_02393 [Pillotina sp. SPG140]